MPIELNAGKIQVSGQDRIIERCGHLVHKPLKVYHGVAQDGNPYPEGVMMVMVDSGLSNGDMNCILFSMGGLYLQKWIFCPDQSGNMMDGYYYIQSSQDIAVLEETEFNGCIQFCGSRIGYAYFQDTKGNPVVFDREPFITLTIRDCTNNPAYMETFLKNAQGKYYGVRVRFSTPEWNHVDFNVRKRAY